MKYCPLRNYHLSDPQECLGEQCALAADEAGDCLVRQTLQYYVSAERTRIAEEMERIRRETELAETYWVLKKDGTRSSIKFLGKDEEEEIYTPSATVIVDDTPQIDGYKTPITYAHITPTEKYSYDGWFEVPRFNGEPE